MYLDHNSQQRVFIWQFSGYMCIGFLPIAIKFDYSEFLNIISVYKDQF